MKRYELELSQQLKMQQELVEKNLRSSMERIQAAEKKVPLFSLKKLSSKKSA
jgi:hypothetical protein